MATQRDVRQPSNGTHTAGDYVTRVQSVDGSGNIVGNGDSTGVIQSSGGALTPRFAVIDHAVSGDNTIVAAVATKKIRVVSLFLIGASAVNVRFESGTGGTALTGQVQLAANGGFVLGYNPVGWFETAAGVLLNLELSGAISVDGALTYIEA